MIKLNNIYQQQISFKRLPFVKVDNYNIPNDNNLSFKDAQKSDVFVKIDADYEPGQYYLKIKNDNYRNIAESLFRISDKEKSIFTAYMDVIGNKNKGKGLGVIMHLNNIMELLENNLSSIKLYSMGHAVLFHGKCKFEPRLNGMEELINTMYTISRKDCSKFPELLPISTKAGKLFDELYEISRIGIFVSEENTQKGNKIAKEYIDFISKQKLTKEEQEEYGFSSGFHMELPKYKIIENKDFFNNLFKKYDIDYEL